jgi:ureidoglycolate lyase
MRRKLRALTGADFAPFGEVFEPPPVGGRRHLASSFQNLRDHAQLDCYINHREPTALPCSVSVMERHVFSSQAFMPCQVSRYVVAAAPTSGTGRPDLGKLQVFVAAGSQAINYRAGVWHCPLIVLDQLAKFVVVMWKDGSSDDEEFIDLAEPLQFIE